MVERMPLSGRIIGVLQRRYIANRLEQGTATEFSDSELVLRHIRTNGLRGLPNALEEMRMKNRRAKETWGDYYRGNTGSMLLIDAIGFFLISIGIKIPIPTHIDYIQEGVNLRHEEDPI